MFITLVHVHAKPEHAEAFVAATLDNARHSVQEPGCARFDVVRQVEDPTRFILIEAFRSEADAVKHKETAHYLRWRDRVAEMMAEPRKGVRYDNCFPADAEW